MKQPTTNINNVEYDLSTTLRVAYMVQGAHNHKPYADIFQGLGDLTLEKQIEILHIAFKVANPEQAKLLPFQQFLDYYLDHFNLKEVMDQLKDVVQGIMGESDESEEETNQGN